MARINGTRSRRAIFHVAPGGGVPTSEDFSAVLLRVTTPSKFQPMGEVIYRYNRYADNASDIEVPPEAPLQCHSRCRLSWVTYLNRILARLFYSHRLALMTERAENFS